MKKNDLTEKRRRVARIIEEFREDSRKFAEEPPIIITEADGMVIKTVNISSLIEELREEDSNSSTA